MSAPGHSQAPRRRTVALALTAGALCAVALAASAAGGARGGLESEGWTLGFEALPVGAGPAQVRIDLAARGDFHVNADYPMAFKPAADGTARFSAPRVALSPSARRACAGRPAETCAVTVELPFTPPGAGEVRVAGTFSFSVCTAERCLIEKVPLALTVAR